MRKRLVLAGVVCAMLAATAVATTATPAAAAAPCWKVLLNDWLDGRIDHIYPVHCYRDAINHLPADVEAYSSARDDILRALQARLAGKHAPPNTDSQSGSGGSGPGGAGGTGSGDAGGSGPSNGPINDALKSGQPSSVDAVPLPLIVLSAIAGLLLALGAIALVARRLQARRVQLRPAESPSQPRNH